MKPFFDGTAVSTLCGLALGLALHGPWHDTHAGGPHLLFSRAEAAEPDHALGDTAMAEETVAVQDASFPSVVDTGPLPADPLPVTRLTRRGGEPIPAAVDVERASIDTADQDSGVTTVGDFHADAADTVTATAQSPSAPTL